MQGFARVSLYKPFFRKAKKGSEGLNSCELASRALRGFVLKTSITSTRDIACTFIVALNMICLSLEK
jgi:hypothetical protein